MWHNQVILTVFGMGRGGGVVVAVSGVGPTLRLRAGLNVLRGASENTTGMLTRPNAREWPARTHSLHEDCEKRYLDLD